MTLYEAKVYKQTSAPHKCNAGRYSNIQIIQHQRGPQRRRSAMVRHVLKKYSNRHEMQCSQESSPHIRCLSWIVSLIDNDEWQAGRRRRMIIGNEYAAAAAAADDDDDDDDDDDGCQIFTYAAMHDWIVSESGSATDSGRTQPDCDVLNSFTFHVCMHFWHLHPDHTPGSELHR